MYKVIMCGFRSFSAPIIEALAEDVGLTHRAEASGPYCRFLFSGLSGDDSAALVLLAEERGVHATRYRYA